jgi:hypothetical protein
VAYHEAGHAVVAVATRIPVKSATIRSRFGEGSRGSVVIPGRWARSLTWDSDGRRLSAYAAYAAAGAVAVAIHLAKGTAVAPEKLMVDLEHDCPSDWEDALAAAVSARGAHRPVGPFLRRTVRRAERILRRHWPAVERVASALRRRTLTGAEVRALVLRKRTACAR